MKCSEVQHDLPTYADGMLAEKQAAVIAVHLDMCPVCRGVNSEMVEVRVALRRMPRPNIPYYLNARVKTAASAERRAIRSSWLPFPADIREWLARAVMPYSVGAVASVALGIGLLFVLNSSVGRYSQFVAPSESGVMLASDRDPWAEPTVDGVSPVAFAKARSNVAGESPSVNPRGALVALTNSFVRGSMKDDEVVVVADVFSDGLAQIAQVVEPSRDTRAVDALEKAFDTEAISAPFVPAKLENRPDSMRVVLRFQRVDVKTGLKKSGRVKL
ncbi:MAG: zf-HC2 domain-containing protein [Acidobacteria bacterium]|nr:zf-HC2 domain-containing protein [Acidobacteriota bacterium]